MEKRQLGTTNIFVNPVELGCMGFSHAYGIAVEKSEAVKTIRSAYDVGYNFFDTAECYLRVNSDGSISNNEEIVGEALKEIRDKVVIATKFGVTHNPDRSLNLDSSPEKIKKSIDGSLKRLQTDFVDLYYQHRIDPNFEPEEIAEVMAKLIKAGKIRAWGISEANEDYLRRANRICPVTVIQNRYSMAARWHENIFPVCEELKISFVAFSPLANGLFAGTYQNKKIEDNDYRKKMLQFTLYEILKKFRRYGQKRKDI